MLYIWTLSPFIISSELKLYSTWWNNLIHLQDNFCNMYVGQQLLFGRSFEIIHKIPIISRSFSGMWKINPNVAPFQVQLVLEKNTCFRGKN